MRKELDNFIIQSNCEIDYFDDIVNCIQNEEKDIFNFFNLKKLSNKFYIIILNYTEFEKEEIKRFGKVIDYVRGITDSKKNLIMILDIEDQKKYTTHKNANLSDSLKMIMHEVVHACNSEINRDNNQTMWFKEGLATNLAHQNYFLVDLSDCDFELLKNEFINYGNNNYIYAYTIVYYILNNYEKDEIDKLVSNSEYLRENSDKLFLEAKDFVLNRRLSSR